MVCLRSLHSLKRDSMKDEKDFQTTANPVWSPTAVGGFSFQEVKVTGAITSLQGSFIWLIIIKNCCCFIYRALFPSSRLAHKDNRNTTRSSECSLKVWRRTGGREIKQGLQGFSQTSVWLEGIPVFVSGRRDTNHSVGTQRGANTFEGNKNVKFRWIFCSWITPVVL